MALWTPHQIIASVAQWFDAADATTITLNGTTVSQWEDKSGNSRHASQATAAAQPTLVSSDLGGLDVISFDGSDWLTHSGGVSSPAISIFVLMSCGTQASYRGVYSTNGATTNDTMLMARGTTDP